VNALRRSAEHTRAMRASEELDAEQQRQHLSTRSSRRPSFNGSGAEATADLLARKARRTAKLAAAKEETERCAAREQQRTFSEVRPAPSTVGRCVCPHAGLRVQRLRPRWAGGEAEGRRSPLRGPSRRGRRLSTLCAHAHSSPSLRLSECIPCRAVRASPCAGLTLRRGGSRGARSRSARESATRA
jgi:hypothetical protein